ncbi:MAG: hypothetical protein M0030_29990 [Actinomycetota bacterium]|nr:hypothetical protein [Actinomycetota bacterium]
MIYTPPKVPCGERSGYPCQRLVSLLSPHCGDRRHFPGANGGRPVARNRPRKIGLTVAEDYDLIEDDFPDLDPVTFDARRVWVTRPALDAWGRHHRLLQARIRLALTRGGYWRTADGGHLLEIGRHQMELSADGRRCVAYVLLPVPPSLPAGSPIEALRPPEWDQAAVTLSPHAVRQFAGRHRVDEDTAADELFDLLDDAAARGKRFRFASGEHALAVDGFTITLAPDGATVVRYATVHAERTPSDVRDKVPSRYGRKHRRSPARWAAWMAERDAAVCAVQPEEWVSTGQIAGCFSPDRARITAGVVPHDQAGRAAEVRAIRERLRRAASAGRWSAGPDGCHFLAHDGRAWTVSPNGHAVLSCAPAWCPSAASGYHPGEPAEGGSGGDAAARAAGP